MPLHTSNSYAFDECSMLKLCKINVPPAFTVFVGGDMIKPRNHDNVKNLVDALDDQNIPRKLFKPSNFRTNSIKMMNEVLEGIGHVQMLGEVFKSEILEQIEDFCEEALKNFEFIDKSDDIEPIKQAFIDNERDLTREGNIPEDISCTKTSPEVFGRGRALPADFYDTHSPPPFSALLVLLVLICPGGAV